MDKPTKLYIMQMGNYTIENISLCSIITTFLYYKRRNDDIEHFRLYIVDIDTLQNRPHVLSSRLDKLDILSCILYLTYMCI